MSKVRIVNKKVRMNLSEIIKFQIMTHCYIKGLMISGSDLDCLTLLGELGPYDLAEFCDISSKQNIFKTTQTVRNCLTKMEKIHLISKEGKSRKKIFLHPDTQIQTTGNLVLNYNLLYVNTEKE